LAESNKDRVDSEKELIHSMETVLELKPEISLAEYLEFRRKLLVKLESK